MNLWLIQGELSDMARYASADVCSCPYRYDNNDPAAWQRGVEAAASLDDPSIPPMPDGEEYDEHTERERQEAWRQYYAAMQMYATTPMMSPGAAMGCMPNVADHQVMPGMMGNPMMNAGVGMNG